MGRIPISLQMYTVRDDAAADFKGTLEKVAKIGYHGVELAGNGGLEANDLKALLNDLGLKISGAHEGLERLESEFGKVVEYHQALGTEFLIIPYLAEERRKNAEGWVKAAADMAEVGRRLKVEGLKLCYHNHSFEFQSFGGQYGLDILYSNAPTDALQAELDTYWIKHGGEDPVAYINKYANRLPLVHVKDMEPGEGKAFAEVGEGILDIKGIFAAAQAAGSKWMIVEQDTCKRPPLESVKISLDNIREMNLA